MKRKDDFNRLFFSVAKKEGGSEQGGRGQKRGERGGGETGRKKLRGGGGEFHWIRYQNPDLAVQKNPVVSTLRATG
jgi:hypothetical protein